MLQLPFWYVRRKCREVCKLSEKNAYIDMNPETEVIVRHHIVNCRIEDLTAECVENVQNCMNCYYVMELKRQLERSELTKKEKVEFIDQVINKVQRERLKNVNCNLQP